MLKTNFNFSAPIKIFLKKHFVMLFLGALISIQSAEAASTPSEVSLRSTPVAPRMGEANPRFVEAILEEFHTFKETRGGVATPADFLAHKTDQLKSDTASAEDRQDIALSIQYVLRGHVFAIQPAAQSEIQAVNIIYARAAMLAAIVPGVAKDKIPGFATSMEADGQRYHRELIQAAMAPLTAATSTDTLVGFTAEIRASEREAISNLTRRPTAAVTPAFSPPRPPVARIVTEDSSDDDGGCCCGLFGGKKKRVPASASATPSRPLLRDGSIQGGVYGSQSTSRPLNME